MRLILVVGDVLYVVRAVVRVVLLEDGERGDHGRRALRIVELCHDVAYPAPVSATDIAHICIHQAHQTPPLGSGTP